MGVLGCCSRLPNSNFEWFVECQAAQFNSLKMVFDRICIACLIDVSNYTGRYLSDDCCKWPRNEWLGRNKMCDSQHRLIIPKCANHEKYLVKPHDWIVSGHCEARKRMQGHMLAFACGEVLRRFSQRKWNSSLFFKVVDERLLCDAKYFISLSKSNRSRDLSRPILKSTQHILV